MAFYFLLQALSLVLFPLYPLSVHAEVRLVGANISSNQTWKASKGPYYVSGWVRVAEGATLTIEPGTVIHFQAGSLIVNGRLDIMGRPDKPVRIIADSQSSGMVLSGADAYMNHLDMSGGQRALDSSGQTSLVITNSTFSQPDYSSSYVTVRDGSTGSFTNNVFSAADSFGYMVQVFDSMTAFTENEFKGTGLPRDSSEGKYQRIGLGIFSTAQSQGGDLSAYRLDLHEVSESKFTRLKHGLEVFRKVLVTARDNAFVENTGSGILIHSEGQVEIVSNSFERNAIGIESYNSSSTIHQNIFELNTENSLSAYGGTVHAAGNWWNSASGPYHSILNTPGTGEVVESDPWVSLYPWLFEKPKKDVCCSSVYFLPGLQGSRLYRKSFGIENQLWEPNRNADVEKLFLNENGHSKLAGIYTRDIIERTNATGGLSEKDIYADFIRHLNSLKRRGTIREWNAFAYDWRFDPEKVVSAGKSRLIADVKSLSENSKTGKVAVVAHSYGGLVFESLLAMLKEEGLEGLLDRAIFVGVPEHGSPKAAISLLHGEGQEIGSGLILSRKTAREFSLNLPAAYSLLPTDIELDSMENSLVRIRAAAAGQAGPDEVVDASGLKSFLLRIGSFASLSIPKSMSDIHVPIQGNLRLVNQFMHRNARVTEKSLSYQSLAGGNGHEGASSTLKMYQIIGTGLPTLAGLAYENACDTLFQRIKAVALSSSDMTCAFSRKPLIDTGGDGVVRVGNINWKTGRKYVFDMSAYNAFIGKNFSHANMVSATPVLAGIDHILKEESAALTPKFLARHDEGSDQAQLLDNAKPLQWITVTGDMYMSNGKEYEIGAHGGTIETGNAFSQIKIGDSFSVQNNIPNSEYITIGDASYFISEIKPISINVSSNALQPVEVKVSYSIPSSSAQPVSPTPASETWTYSYPSVAVAQGSFLSIVTSISSSSIQSVSPTSSVPFLGIDEEGDGISDETLRPDAVEVRASDGSTAVFVIEQDSEENISFELALNRLKMRLAASTVSEPYKSRYYRKAEALERKRADDLRLASTSNSTPEALSAKSFTYLQRNVASLTAIFSDLSSEKKGIYRGGMKAQDAVFLYREFLRVAEAYVKNLAIPPATPQTL